MYHILYLVHWSQYRFHIKGKTIICCINITHVNVGRDKNEKSATYIVLSQLLPSRIIRNINNTTILAGLHNNIVLVRTCRECLFTHLIHFSVTQYPNSFTIHFNVQLRKYY